MKSKIKIVEYEFKSAEPEDIEIKSPEKIFEVLRDDFCDYAEEMYLIIMDTKNRVIEKILITKGGANIQIITPRDVFVPLLRMGKTRCIIAHNHPSGNIMPSPEDIQMTRRLSKAANLIGISLLDHIIYSAEDYTSLKDKGVL